MKDWQRFVFFGGGGFCFCWNPPNKNALRSRKHISSKPLRIRFGSMEVLESTIIIKTWILVMKTMSWLSWAQSSFLGFWIQRTSISVGKTTFWGAPIRWKNCSFSKENSFFQWNWGKKLKNSSISYHLFLGPFSWLDSSLLVFVVAEFFFLTHHKLAKWVILFRTLECHLLWGFLLPKSLYIIL